MPVVKIKYGAVDLAAATPHHAIILAVVSQVFIEHGYDCVVTDACRDRPSGSVSLSMHHVGRALDFRLNDIPRAVADAIADEVRECWADQGDVLDHGSGANYHLHVEYDPRTG